MTVKTMHQVHDCHLNVSPVTILIHQVSAVSTVKTGWGNNDFHSCKTLIDTLVTFNIESKLSELYAAIISTVILNSIQTAVSALPC